MKWIYFSAFFLVLFLIPQLLVFLELFFSHPFRYFLAVGLGVVFYCWLIFKKDGKELPYLLKIIFFGLNLVFFIVWGVALFIGKASGLDGLVHILFIFLGILLVSLTERIFIPYRDKILKFFTKKASTERDGKTDVRNIENFLPKSQGPFNPEDYYEKGMFFLGLENQRPIYLTGRIPHIQVMGTTGSGKTVFIQSFCNQWLLNGGSLVCGDPKFDEFLIFALKKGAKAAGVPCHILDLNSDVRQINFLHGATTRQISSLLESAMGLERTGKASDFYKAKDRKMAKDIAKLVREGDTFESLYREHSKMMLKRAENFEQLFSELADLLAINAPLGIPLKEIVNSGGVIYMYGSMDAQDIKMAQKMMLIRVKQIAEERDRIKETPKNILFVCDEAQNFVSRTFLDAFGAARDKKLTMLLAHQSVSDFKDNESGLDGQATFDRVFENTALKLIYRLQSPDTARVFIEKSCDILVDEEVREVDKSFSLVESTSGGKRVIRQTERPRFDKNMILNLPDSCGIIFSNEVTKMVFTSPVQVTKNYEDLVVQDFGEHESVDETKESNEIFLD